MEIPICVHGPYTSLRAHTWRFSDLLKISHWIFFPSYMMISGIWPASGIAWVFFYLMAPYPDFRCLLCDLSSLMNFRKPLVWSLSSVFTCNGESDSSFLSTSELKLEVGPLAGTVGRICDSWPPGCKFKPHVGCGNYLKEKTKIKLEMDYLFLNLRKYYLASVLWYSLVTL